MQDNLNPFLLATYAIKWVRNYYDVKTRHSYAAVENQLQVTFRTSPHKLLI